MMVDFYQHTRLRMMDAMQGSLKQIRQVLGMGVQEFGDVIGLSRQSINNLETRKNKLSATQYVAICAVIDTIIKDRQELFPVISSLLNEEGDLEASHNGSFLSKWFLCFPDDAAVVGFGKTTPGGVERINPEELAEHYTIFLDDSASMDAGIHAILKEIVPYMKAANNRFLVPLLVVETLQEQLLVANGTQAAIVKEGLQMLMQLQREGVLEIRGEKTDVTIAGTLVSVFAKFKNLNRIALLTRNGRLAQAVLNLNNDEIGGFRILALKTTPDGKLQSWTEAEFADEETWGLEKDWEEDEPLTDSWETLEFKGGDCV